MEIRLDLLVARQLCVSREYAKEIILDGKCSLDGVTVLRPGAKFADTTIVDISADRPKYVSRGGLKLAGALDEFDICLDGLQCLDIGASTGGFTDCMLKRGAKCVIALDNGHGQLDRNLLTDDRVTSMEGIDIRNVTLTDLPFYPEFITCDVSFISLEKIVPSVSALFTIGTRGVFLLKPQFECGPGQTNKHGVVTDMSAHTAAIKRVCDCFNVYEIDVCGIRESSIKGRNGNTEYLIFVSKSI